MIRKILSLDASPFWQFVKYGVIGVLATLIQAIIFYVASSLVFKCLASGDFAVVYLGLPEANFTGDEPWYATRGMLASINTAFGFIIANIFCWLMNRKFVFKPGKYSWLKELVLFFSCSASATLVALGIMKFLIDSMGASTSFALVVEVLASFFINFFIRKFFIFKR
ncbi:MAG: GtrA family protein [Kiritimatiellae bacterium]|nr:GtrA family protein [Kiritimatiellia bacterium]